MTDETYIKMVLALPDSFFEGWELQTGDKIISGSALYTVIGGNELGALLINENMELSSTNNLNFGSTVTNYKPIPNQAQLLKMLNLSPIELIEDFYEYYQETLKEDGDEIFKSSIVCLTLAYVMDRKFGKYWDGEAWES